MTPFHRDGDRLLVRLSATERMLLARLAIDLQEVLRDAGTTAVPGILGTPAGPGAPDEWPQVRLPEGDRGGLASTRGGEAGAAADPAVARLLPDAYPGDAEASAEFRRFTEGELLDRKVAQQRTIARLFGDDVGESVALAEPDALALLRGLGDLRLVLAERLGIHEDGDDGMSVPGNELTANIYAWLGYLQGCLVTALDA